MSKCSKCGAPARHGPPDGDFRYDPPAPRRLRLEGNDAYLVGNLIIPMVEQRSREPGDGWEQAANVLRKLI